MHISYKNGMSGLTDASYIQLESDRLAKKLQNINSEVSAQSRASVLTDSYRKRFSNYLIVLVILIFAFIGYLGINKAQESFPQIPSMVFDGLFLVIILIVAYYVYYTLTDLAIRSNMNYDEVDLPPPKGVSIGVNPLLDANNKAHEKGDITGQVSQGVADCSGTVCCGPGTSWDPNTNFCLPIQTFTTIDESNKLLSSSHSSGLVENGVSSEPRSEISYQMTMYHL